MPAANTEKEKLPPKTNPFKVPEGKISILLLPTEKGSREMVEDMFIEQGFTIDDLPKIARDNEIKVPKLASKHVIFTAVGVATAVGFKKRPEKFKLVISPPLDCAKFSSAAEDEDEFGEISTPELAQAIQKYISPNVVKISSDNTLRIMSV